MTGTWLALAMMPVASIWGGCSRPGVAPVPAETAAASAELAAARDLLREYRSFRIVVDSQFAAPDQAPPALTGTMRPRARTLALAESLATAGQPGEPAVVLRLSPPMLQGDSAHLSVTADFPSPGEPGRRGYETVRYVLEWQGTGWRVRSRTQLGIS